MYDIGQELVHISDRADVKSGLDEEAAGGLARWPVYMGTGGTSPREEKESGPNNTIVAIVANDRVCEGLSM